MSARLSGSAILLCVTSLLAAAASATTFAPIPDQSLSQRAPVIAEITVVSQNPSPAPEHPATEYLIHVDRLLKGSVAGSALVVRVPGGAAAGELGLVVWGAPAFRDDDRALLFLVPNADGSYHLLDLMLGAFHEVALGERRLAVRDLAESGEIEPGAAGALGVAPAHEGARDFARFADWLADRAAGGRRPADYQVPLAAGELDQAERLAHAGKGDAGLHAPAGGEQEDAAAAFAGATRSLAGLDRFDGHNSILYGNSGGNPDLPAFSCGAGGLASLSGTWYDRDRQVLGGNVILAAGVACLFAGQAVPAEGGLQALLAHDQRQAALGARSMEAALGARSMEAALAARSMEAALAARSMEAALAARPGEAEAAALDRTRAHRPHGVRPPPASSAVYMGRGYQPRGCGFDLNRNGIFGEAADCHICDGTTADPLGSGGRDNLVYVACGMGNDNPGCGGPGNPCGSIKYAWNSRTLPAGSAGSDIICFRGTCREDSITPGVSGKPGTYTVAKGGSEAQDWQLPTRPTMLVGWDYDHNGQYPPYDKGDTAVLEGSGLAHALRLNVNTTNSYVEMAHFTVRNYGTGGTGGSFPAGAGFATLGGANGQSSHLYFHDISVQNVNAGAPLDSNRIIFDFFGLSTTQLRYVTVHNLEVLNSGGYFARGSGPTAPGSPESGPFRFKNITYRALGCSDSGAGACADPGSEAHVVGFKLWGYISGVEVLDSIFDLNVGAWRPHASGFGATAFLPAQCSRNWTIRNNEIDNFKVGLTVQGYAWGYCDGAGARPVDHVVFDRNTFRNTYSPWVYGNNGVSIIGGGPNPATSVGNVLVSNNFFSAPTGWQGMAYIDAGNNGGPDPGVLQFVNNTTVAPMSRPGFGAFTLVKSNNFVPQTVAIVNNIVAGFGGGGGENIHSEYIPAVWGVNSNVYDPNGSFTYNRVAFGNLAGLRAAAGSDGGSRVCSPSFVNPAGGDFHLNGADSCAKDAGTAVGNLVTWDIDGNGRPKGLGWDVGAHEVQH
jgi:hypothetical protein